MDYEEGFILAGIVAAITAAAGLCLIGLTVAAHRFSEMAPILDALKLAVTFVSGLLGKIVFDSYQGRGRKKTAVALIIEELQQADLTCKNKIEEWAGRIRAARDTRVSYSGYKTPIKFYPAVCTVAFDAVAPVAIRLPDDTRAAVFKAYYALIRRRDASDGAMDEQDVLENGHAIIDEITSLRQSIEEAVSALRGDSPSVR